MKILFTRLFLAAVIIISATHTTFSQAQTTIWQETASFKGGGQALDSFLTQNINDDQLFNGDRAIVLFTITPEGNIIGLSPGEGSGLTAQLKNALLKSSGQWNCVMQNNHCVFAMCRIKVRYHKNKIEVDEATAIIFSQPTTDTVKAGDDMDKIFTREEVKPSFKGGVDSLNSFLMQNVNTNGFSNNEKITVIFIVSAKGDISGFRGGDDSTFTEQIKSALLKSSGLWNNGLQNNRPINAFCRLTVNYHKHKIEAVIE